METLSLTDNDSTVLLAPENLTQRRVSQRIRTRSSFDLRNDASFVGWSKGLRGQRNRVCASWRKNNKDNDNDHKDSFAARSLLEKIE